MNAPKHKPKLCYLKAKPNHENKKNKHHAWNLKILAVIPLYTKSCKEKHTFNYT